MEDSVMVGILSFILGAVFGILVGALLTAGSEADDTLNLP